MKQNNEQLKNFFVKELENEEFTGSFDYEIHAEPFLGEYGNGEPCTFKPHVADVRFGRTNEERRANAEHIVKCCNGYEALIKQNADLKEALKDLLSEPNTKYQMVQLYQPLLDSISNQLIK